MDDNKIDGMGSNGGGNLLELPLFLSRWQRQQQPIREDTIHIVVLTVVDEGGWQQRLRQRRQLAMDNSVNSGGRQQRAASSPIVVGCSEAIICGQCIMAGSRRLVQGRIIYW
jgi:hypothetical protein